MDFLTWNYPRGTLVYSGRLGALGHYYSSPAVPGNDIFIAPADGKISVKAENFLYAFGE